MFTTCAGCGKELSDFKLWLKGQVFCSYTCMNRVNHLTEMADLFQFG